MEAYFLDIGLGSSAVVLLGGGRALVLDCGKYGGILLQVLRRFHVSQVARLIVSHNHDDHVGGAVSVLTEFEGSIEKVCFLDDGELRGTKFWQKVYQQVEVNKTLSRDQLVRLESGDQPRLLYREPSLNLTLKVLSPRFAENLLAADAGDPNATSAVVALTVEGRKIVFAGDSSIDQWEQIRAKVRRPLECDILSVPHHGGIVWSNPSQLAWLYSEGIQPRFAILSVATSNTYGHPREDVILALNRAGARVLCNQITIKCCNNLESLRPGVLPPILPGRSKPGRDLTTSGWSRNVACAGTIVADLSGGELVIRRFDEHQVGVDRLTSMPGGPPLCRR